MPASVRTVFARSLRRAVCLFVLAAASSAAPAAAQQTVAIVLQVTGGQTNPPLYRFAQIRVGTVVQVPASARMRFIYLPGCRDVDAAGGTTVTFGVERYEVRGGAAPSQPAACPRVERLENGEGALPAGSMVRADQAPLVGRPSGTGQAQSAPPTQPLPTQPPPPPVAAPPTIARPLPAPTAPPSVPSTPMPTLRSMPPDAVPGLQPGSTRPGPEVRLTPEAATRPSFILLGGYWRRVAAAELRAGGQVVARWTVTSPELAWPAGQPALQDGALYTLVLAGTTAAETMSFSFRASGRLGDEPVMLSLD